MSATPNRGYRFPASTDSPPDIPFWMNALATDLDTSVTAVMASMVNFQDFPQASVNWTSGGTAPSIGNGNIAAQYIQIGGSSGPVAYWGTISMGGTTGFGSANAWSIALPILGTGTAIGTGSAFFFDASTTANKTPGALITGTSTLSFSSIGGPVAQSVPFLWASGDHLSWFYLYRPA